MKTLFFGKYVGKDEFGNKYYKNKKDERWVIYADNIEATKITSDWYLMDTSYNRQNSRLKSKKFSWQKKHLENKTGTKDSYKPTRIKKNNIKKKYEVWK